MDFNALKNDLKRELDQTVDCQNLLYRRGYLISNRSDFSLQEYPFYGNWSSVQINDFFYAYIHKDQHLYMRRKDGMTAVLIGHAYNPFTMQYDENEILDRCLSAWQNSREQFFSVINELAGIHVIGIFSEQNALMVQDCIGMKSCYYSNLNGNIYITSHCSILQDVDSPHVSEFVDQLIHTHAFRHWGSGYLPGDITVFDGLRRLGPNLCLELRNGVYSVHRFFPLENHPVRQEEDHSTIKEIAALLQNSVSLCARKWDRPAVSLSGGTDSRTTLSSASQCYDKFKYYSFYCKEAELVDAQAAHDICDTIGMPHTIYPIPANNEDCAHFELYKKIISHNSAYVSIPGDHEIRKYIFLSQLNDFDAELKSWVSEIGRVYWDRRFGFDLPAKFTPRDFTISQTRFLGPPRLMHQNDACYKDFLQRSGFVYPMYNYEHTDLFYWEYRFGAWGTLVTTGQDIFGFEVTMPMNCRKLIDMFLWYPREFRKHDMVHKYVIAENEPKFGIINNEVRNNYFSNKRVLLEKLYYHYRMLFYRDK